MAVRTVDLRALLQKRSPQAGAHAGTLNVISWQKLTPTNSACRRGPADAVAPAGRNLGGAGSAGGQRHVGSPRMVGGEPTRAAARKQKPIQEIVKHD